MRYHYILFVLVLTASLAVRPGEAGLLNWIRQKFWNLFSLFKQDSSSVINERGSTNWDITWPGPEYQLKIRQSYDKQQCKEEISVLWNGSKVAKTFKPKCLQNGVFRNMFNHQALLLIGNPTDDFCAFSCKKNEYYYKESGKWIKGNTEGDKIQELGIGEPEITQVTNKINKWREVVNEHNSIMNAIREEQKRVGDTYNQEISKTFGLMTEAGNRYNQNMQDLTRMRNEEDQRQEEDRAKYNKMKAEKGWSAAVQRYEREMQKRMQQANKAIQVKQSADMARYQEEMVDIEKKITEETAKNQEENMKFQDKYAQEEQRFSQEYQTLIEKC